MVVGIFHVGIGGWLFQESGKDGAEFRDEFVGLHRLGLAVPLAAGLSDHTVRDVIGEQLDAQRVERGADSGDLIEDVHAIPVLGDHPVDPGDLAGDAFESAG